MLLEAETTDARQTFAQMAGDESTHLAWITPYVLDHERTGPHGPFLRLIVDLIEGGPPAVLIYALQVVLEGWGLSHYQSLAEACQFEPLHNVFSAIRRDEAVHHRTGQIMLDPRQLGRQERALVLEAMASFLELVRAGPIGVMAAISECHGEIDVPALERLFEDLSGVESAAAKLALLRRLMDVEGMEWVATDLDERGLFLPVNPITAARIVHSSLSEAS
jgi:rubrerythrin